MAEVLRSVASVGTPLALLGLVAAFAYYAYSRRLKYEEKRLELLPADERAKRTDEYLTRYRIDGGNLRIDDKVALIREEMEKRHRRSLGYAIISAVVAVVCFGIAAAAYAFRPAQQEPAATSQTDQAPSSQALQATRLGIEFALIGGRQLFVEDMPSEKTYIGRLHNSILSLLLSLELPKSSRDAVELLLTEKDTAKQLPVVWRTLYNDIESRHGADTASAFNAGQSLGIVFDRSGMMSKAYQKLAKDDHEDLKQHLLTLRQHIEKHPKSFPRDLQVAVKTWAAEDLPFTLDELRRIRGEASQWLSTYKVTGA